jgi:hypothetical protein
MPLRALGGGWAKNVVALTAATKTVSAADCGTVFTNRGSATTCTVTLPPTAALLSGWWCEFYTVAAQAFVITSSPADTLVVHADATADTVTTAATIGQHIQVICDGTGFLFISDPSAASAATAVTAVTIAT